MDGLILIAVFMLLVFAFSFMRSYNRSKNRSVEDDYKVAVREATRRGLDPSKIQEINNRELTTKQ